MAEINAASSSIVDKVSKIFYENDDFANALEKFANEHAHQIDADEIERSDVMKIEYTLLHAQYQALFESQIESFILGCGSTVEEFYNELKGKSESDPGCSEAKLGQFMLAVADFDVFMLMMIFVAKDARDAASATKPATAATTEETVTAKS